MQIKVSTSLTVTKQLNRTTGNTDELLTFFLLLLSCAALRKKPSNLLVSCQCDVKPNNNKDLYAILCTKALFGLGHTSYYAVTDYVDRFLKNEIKNFVPFAPSLLASVILYRISLLQRNAINKCCKFYVQITFIHKITFIFF